MSLFGSLFSRKVSLDPIDLGTLQVDIHSHLIPGIDDGARSMDESIAMLAKFESLGYKKVITTPHILQDYYKNTPEIILSGLDQLRNTATKIGLTIQIDAAAEYYYDDSFFSKLTNGEEILTFGDNYVLFEFSFIDRPSGVDKLFFELLSRGYKPVVAHFERYLFLNGDISLAKEWREKGVRIQLNLNSLTDHYGPIVKEQARKLIDSEQIDFVGTDCHRMQHLLLLENNLKDPYLHKILKLNLLNHDLL